MSKAIRKIHMDILNKKACVACFGKINTLEKLRSKYVQEKNSIYIKCTACSESYQSFMQGKILIEAHVNSFLNKRIENHPEIQDFQDIKNLNK